METIKQTFHRDELVMSLNRRIRDVALQCKFCEGRRGLSPFVEFLAKETACFVYSALRVTVFPQLFKCPVSSPIGLRVAVPTGRC